jgi:non-ribosomal peptide synthase protein (TIGR01720 family)
MGPGQPSRLLIIVHHLVVDGISWRVLLEDLQIAYRQFKNSGSIQLPAKTSSFRSWVDTLRSYGNSPALRKEADYWIDQAVSTPLPRDFSDPGNTISDVEVVTVSLDLKSTQALLQDVPKSHNVQIQEILLMALARVVGEWSENKKTVIEVEGHGRQDVGASIDVTRTVGWFTTRYPVVLPWNRRWTTHRQLSVIRQVLQAVPNAGIGYGVLRYLADAQLRQALCIDPEICFNYLGQFDQLFDDTSILSPLAVPVGPMQSPLGRRLHLIEVVAWVAKGQFQVNWAFSRNTHAGETIQYLAKRFLEVLQEFIAGSGSHRMQSENTDVEIEGISQDELAEILDDVAHN